MSPPTLTDYSLQYKDDGVLLNADTGMPLVDVTQVKGLDSATPRVSQRDTEGQDGSTVEAEFESTRVISVAGTLYASDAASLESLVDSLKANFSVSRIHKTPGAGQRVLYAKCVSGFRCDWDPMRRVSTANFGFTLQSGDPIIYGMAQHNIGAPLDTTAVPGFAFSFGFSFSFGSPIASAGTVLASNDGNRPAPWQAIITGPVTNPSVLSDTVGGRQVKLNLTLNTASTLIIDSQTRSATVDGSDRTGKFTREEWFGMMPGVNQIRLLADSTGVGATIALQYYDAWR
jgi:hypothetical protein